MSTCEVEHGITVAAPAATVYGLVAEVANWPQVFPPTVHVQHVERGERGERIRIWATANGTAKTWMSRRELDPHALRVTFRQEVSQPPVASMGGAWVIEPLMQNECRVRLLHDYRAVFDDPERLAWIDQAVDRNSQSELAALKAHAEAPQDLFSFDDSVRINGTEQDVYDFLNEAGHWQERLPHVARVTLQEEIPGLQILEMDTRTADGSTHTTRSVRACLPHHRIVYKQIQLPKLMTLHTGHWSIEAHADGGLVVTSRHTVKINEENVVPVLGDGAGLDEAKAYVRKTLSTNSLATLEYATAYAESIDV